jgi:hypothetical protein
LERRAYLNPQFFFVSLNLLVETDDLIVVCRIDTISNLAIQPCRRLVGKLHFNRILVLVAAYLYRRLWINPLARKQTTEPPTFAPNFYGTIRILNNHQILHIIHMQSLKEKQYSYNQCDSQTN